MSKTDGRVWLLLVALAVALTVACGGSSTSPGPDDAAGPGAPAESAARSMTQG